MSIRNWKRSQVLGTRAHLLETAAGLFGEHGYANTALERLVREAGLTRGAVYHHFKDKRDLFDAVVDQALRTLVERVERETIRRAVERGGEREADAVELFVDALAEGRSQQILCVDAPAVLGRERFGELMEARLMAPIRRVVEKGARRGQLGPELVESLSHLLFGAVLEAALLVGAPGRSPVRRQDLDDGLTWLLDRILGPGG